MDYTLIIILQVLGVGFHVMQKVISLGAAHPEDTPSAVFRAFMKEDWDTLIVSALILSLNLVVHYILDSRGIVFGDPKEFDLIMYGLAFVLGYAGQRVVYKYLGTAEKILGDKADKLNDLK